MDTTQLQAPAEVAPLMARSIPPDSAVAAITVPGRGAVLVEPDVASVRLGVSVVRPTARDAREAAGATMQAILEALRSGGVAPTDLRTTLVGLDAVRDYSSPSGPTVTGYGLTNVVEATVRSVDAVGRLIDAALGAGATSMDGLEFRLADPSAATAEARRRAVADARDRAQTLADEAGVSLGAVLSIVEGSPAAGPPHPMAERMKAMTDAAATPVESGTSEVVVDIAVAFAIA